MIAKTEELPTFPNIRACLFDMDGLLLDTEDIYTHCNNLILQEYGRPNVPWSIKTQLLGRPGPEAAAIFHAWARLPIPRSEFNTKQRTYQTHYFPTARPLPGIPLLLKTLRNNNIHLALATSSHSHSYKLKTRNNGPMFRAAFEDHKRILGDDERIPPGRGKPCPDIYLLALESINVELRAKGEREVLPSECLVFEDSVPGVEAGRRAGMRVVWCPHPMLMSEYKGREAEVLAGLANRTADEILLAMASDPVAGKGAIVQPGSIGDGWGEMFTSLDQFDAKKYGIGV